MTLDGCPRGVPLLLTIEGASFGAEGASVFVGSAKCEGTAHAPGAQQVCTCSHSFSGSVCLRPVWSYLR